MNQKDYFVTTKCIDY